MTSQGVLGQQCWKTLGCSVLTVCSILVLWLVTKGSEQSHLTKTYCRYQVRFCMLWACYDAEVCKTCWCTQAVLFWERKTQWNGSVLCSGYLKPSSTHFGWVLPLCLQLKRSLNAITAAGVLRSSSKCCWGGIVGGFFPVVHLGPVGEARTGGVMWKWLCVMALRYKALLQTIFSLHYSF